ncbi:hypothetical protein [Haloarcula sp. CBA1128]|uniref:hypothetical protein n=1 Tax=Haloarcula sp. CBA1128 TaxID=1765056 RepID=UPI0012AB6999|nr:hypothetical protein [Haloarcula sp. CBA1128]
MKRRKILQAMGAGGITLSMTGIGSAKSGDSSPKESEVVEMEELEGKSLVKARQDVMSNEDVKRLIQEASRMGWRSQSNEMSVVRKTVETQDETGTIDTAVITFESLEKRGRGKDGDQENRDDPESADADEMYLHFDVNVDEEVQSALVGSVNRPELIHFKYDHSSDKESESTSSSLFDQVTVHYVGNNQVQSDTIVSEEPRYKTDTNSKATTQSTEYCEVDAKVYDTPSLDEPCVDTECIIKTYAGTVVTVVSCLAGGGLLCLAGLSLNGASLVDCISCNTVYEGRISFEKEWLEEQAPRQVDDPCSELTSEHVMAISKCGVQKAPTKESYNYPEC